MSTLKKLMDYGQSYWLDNLSRDKIENGEIKRRVTEQGLRGITSNPSIFNEAISGSSLYDKQIKSLVRQDKSISEIYDALTIKDVQDACDILEPVFAKSNGTDGFVSLEVGPGFARDTEGSMFEAHRLYKAVARKNCLIKIPGTIEGIPAIEQMLYEGVNINITLLFSVDRYVEIAKTYIRALQRRVNDKKPLAHIVSVASFFLSRIDTLTDEILSQYLKKEDASQLLGKAGTASAVIAYQRFKEIFSSKDWKKLEAHGANVQRVLWASTSNKDILYDDLRYVEPLIAPDTVNTLPDKTITLFDKEGTMKENAIEDGLSEAKHFFAGIKKFHIDMNVITQQLENEGVQKFDESFQKLMGDLSQKRLKLLKDTASSQKINPSSLEKDWKSVCASLDEIHAGERMFAKDPSLWKKDKAQLESINKGLGWLDLPEIMLPEAEKFMAFARQIKKEKFTSVVLLGMGGSSLCSEVARETFKSAKDYPKLFVLDNTEPAAIKALQHHLNLEKTLFIVASKSGSTLETNCFFRHFYDLVEKKLSKKAGANFVAITDAGTSLMKLAKDYNFRNIFINSPGVGGRYSVLSDFGILPMALVGIDVKAILQSSKQMMLSCGAEVPAIYNPGIGLGALLGLAQKKKRDKVTFVLSDSLKPFGFWIEQLLAESTGKEGKGLIPVNGEKLDAPNRYASDRIFVHLYLNSDSNKSDEIKLKALEKANHPVVHIGIPNKNALGGVYYLWEIATATAGRVIGINPFDQPNVAESKKNTNTILDEWMHKKSFDEFIPDLGRKEIKLFLKQAKQNDYISLLPYFSITPARDKILSEWRESLKKEFRVATTLLNGPRYLHSTGQLHKGGPDSGLYILLVADDAEDITIPGKEFGFEILHRAQSLGDYRSLHEKGRRVILVNLEKDIDKSLKKISR